jgi:hypothetical protein
MKTREEVYDAFVTIAVDIDPDLPRDILLSQVKVMCALAWVLDRPEGAALAELLAESKGAHAERDAALKAIR